MNTVRSFDRDNRVVVLDDGTVGTIAQYLNMYGDIIEEPEEAFTIIYSPYEGAYTYALMFDQYVPLH